MWFYLYVFFNIPIFACLLHLTHGTYSFYELRITWFRRSEEERRKAAEEERVQLEMEERKAWEALQIAQERKAELGEILETERQEAERKAEEAKLQTEREEAERIEEGER